MSLKRSVVLCLLAGCGLQTGHAAKIPVSTDSWFSTLRSEAVISDPSYVWKQFGPGMSGNNYLLYWHPTDPDVLFLGPNMGNAYRSADRGTTYESVLDGDSAGWRFNERGPVQIISPDFSRQNPDFGFCTGEKGALLYRTDDRGKSWHHVASADAVWNNIRLNTLVVDPQNDQVWYAGSGTLSGIERFTFTDSQPHGKGIAPGHQAKIFKTTDQGASWSDITPAGLDPQAQITRILVHPGNPDILFAATTYGLFKSSDGGASWAEKTQTGLDQDVLRSLDMHFDPTTGAVTLYAVDLVKWSPDPRDPQSVISSGGIFRSIDEGESWQSINGDLGVNLDVLKTNWSFRKSWYKALNAWFGIKDAETRYPRGPTNLLHSFLNVRVDPNNPAKIFATNDYKSQPTTFPGGMLWRTDDGGAHWIATLRNGTAWDGEHKAYWTARGNPTDCNIELRAQRKWMQRDSYERKAGGLVAFNADSSVILYQWAKVVCVSTDGGDTWVESDEAETAPGSGNWVCAGNSNLPGHGLRQDARLPDRLLLPSGENDVWITASGGNSIRPGAQAARRMPLGPQEYSCSDVVLHPDHPEIIYTLQFRQANAGELLRSTDGGKTFAVCGHAIDYPPPPGKGHGDQSIHQLCLTIDPDHPDNLYFCVPKSAAMLGYVGDSVGGQYGVRKSTDGGVSWNWAGRGLPASRNVACLRMDPNDSATLYACVTGKNGGLFISTDRAASWARHPAFPAHISSVQDLHFATDGKLYASCGTPTGKWQDGGVWLSPDAGETWRQLFQTRWTRMTKTAPLDPNVILVAMDSWKTAPIQNPGTFLSQDGGASWKKINRGNPQSDRINDIAIDQIHPDIFYVSTYGAGWMRADRVPDAH